MARTDGRIERQVGGRRDREQVEPTLLDGAAQQLAMQAREGLVLEREQEALQVRVRVRETVGKTFMGLNCFGVPMAGSECPIRSNIKLGNL